MAENSKAVTDCWSFNVEVQIPTSVFAVRAMAPQGGARRLSPKRRWATTNGGCQDAHGLKYGQWRGENSEFSEAVTDCWSFNVEVQIPTSVFAVQAMAPQRGARRLSPKRRWATTNGGCQDAHGLKCGQWRGENSEFSKAVADCWSFNVEVQIPTSVFAVQAMAPQRGPGVYLPKDDGQPRMRVAKMHTGSNVANGAERSLVKQLLIAGRLM